MNTRKLARFWVLATVVLVAVTIVGIILIWIRYHPGQPVEIALAPSQAFPGKIYICGAVAAPGSYPFSTGDSIEALIQVAGGVTGSANLSALKLYVPETGNTEPQKIDINRAEAWLLQALPGIGQTLAQRIIDYRQQNGLFQNIGEITGVAGIGSGIYEKIKDLITVGE